MIGQFAIDPQFLLGFSFVAHKAQKKVGNTHPIAYAAEVFVKNSVAYRRG